MAQEWRDSSAPEKLQEPGGGGGSWAFEERARLSWVSLPSGYIYFVWHGSGRVKQTNSLCGWVLNAGLGGTQSLRPGPPLAECAHTLRDNESGIKHGYARFFMSDCFCIYIQFVYVCMRVCSLGDYVCFLTMCLPGYV